MNEALLLRTATFAANAHRFQRRKDSDATPYINHPLGVADLIANVGGVQDLVVLQAALLHDTVEDTETSIDDIRLEFGEDVANIVAEVTDDKSLTKLERKRQQIEHAMQASKQAKLVKLADKLYNLKDIQKSIPSSWTVERAQAYFGWSQEVINQLRGTNEPLERELEKVLGGVITHNGHQIPCLPPGYQPGDWEKNTPSH